MYSHYFAIDELIAQLQLPLAELPDHEIGNLVLVARAQAFARRKLACYIGILSEESRPSSCIGKTDRYMERPARAGFALL